MNQWSGEQLGGTKYGTERWDINAEVADAEPEEAMQRQQRLRRAKRACVIHAKGSRSDAEGPRGCTVPQRADAEGSRANAEARRASAVL